MPTGSDKFASPGAFRLALALAVFLHHTTNFNIGLPAVLIFFVLSGYWVATMWAQIYSKTSASYFTYLTSRVWRVAPVFALCSAISWLLLVGRAGTPEGVGNVAHQIFSNVMILGYNSLPFQANIPAWSLDMEMQFYLIAPAVVFLVSKNIVVLFVCAAFTLFSHLIGGSTTVAPFLYFFGIGVAAASRGFMPDRRLAYGSLWATLATLLVFALILIKGLVFDEAHKAPLLAFGSASSFLIALMMAPWALYTTRQIGGANDRMLGDLSYIFYLLHWSVLGALRTGEGSYLDRILLCSEALIVIFLSSYVIWRLFDRPINKLRAAWVSSRRILPTQDREAPDFGGGAQTVPA
jgi:peptidoglycan/LPS O-acetylase OafA/YrhL